MTPSPVASFNSRESIRTGALESAKSERYREPGALPFFKSSYPQNERQTIFLPIGLRLLTVFSASKCCYVSPINTD